MIKYNIDHKNSVLNLEVEGDTVTIAADVTLLMSEIYSDIKAKNPDSAKDFKKYIITAIEDGIVFASKEERESIIRKKYEEVEVAVELTKKVLDSLFDSIKRWKDDTDTDSD